MKSAPAGHFEQLATPAAGDVGDLPEDPRLMAAVQEYLDQLEAGRRPNRQEFLRQFPDLAGPLTACLEGLELVYKTSLREKLPPGGPAMLASESGDALPANPLGDFQ